MAARFARVLLEYALAITALTPILIVAGWVIISRAEKLGVSDDISNKAKCKGGRWFNPYGLAQNYVDDGNSTKKAYYIVDSETNAIVDIIRLGKWGQKWLKYRTAR